MRLAHVFSSEFCEISKNTFSTENLQVTASIHYIFYLKTHEFIINGLLFFMTLWNSITNRILMHSHNMKWHSLGLCSQLSHGSRTSVASVGGFTSVSTPLCTIIVFLNPKTARVGCFLLTLFTSDILLLLNLKNKKNIKQSCLEIS